MSAAAAPMSPVAETQGRRRLASLAATATPMISAAVVVVASAVRLHYGVDVTDEAYYAAIPYRFVLGDVPYTSELNVRQNAGLLMTPLVRLWTWIQGDTDGLMLFLRYMDLLMRVALGALAAWVLARRAPATLALMAATLVCGFVFFSLPALSYNTMSAAAVTASLLCILLWMDDHAPRHGAAALTLAALAAFIHPGLLSVALLTAGTMIVLAPAGAPRRSVVKACLAVAITGVVLVAALALALGAENVGRLLNVGVTYAGPAPSAERLLRQTRKVLALASGGWLLLMLWFALWGFSRLGAAGRAVVLLAYVGIAASRRGEELMVWLAVGSLPLAFRGWRMPGGREMLAVSLLSVAAGTAVSLFSTNGLWNMSHGSQVGAMTFFIAAFRLMSRDHAPARDARVVRLLPAGAAALAAGSLVISQYDYVFRDDPIPALITVVPSGPYQGMRTTQHKRDYLLILQDALRAHATGNRSLLAFYGLPAAHLMVPVRPALATTWVANYDEEYMRKMRRDLATLVPRARRPVLVLQVFRIRMSSDDWRQWQYPPDDPLLAAVMRERPRLLMSNREFALYQFGLD